MAAKKDIAMPVLWQIYPAPLPGSVTYRWFQQFDVPTEVIIGGHGEHGNQSSNMRPIQGRIWVSEFKIRPDGTVEHWHLHNDGKGQQVECQEVFDDHGDDGHTSYELVGVRYVPSGTDPWWQEDR